MVIVALLSGLLLVARNAQAQSTTSVYSEAGVPTGAPVAGDYTGALRPQIHFSPPKNFLVGKAPAARTLFG